MTCLPVKIHPFSRRTAVAVILIVGLAVVVLHGMGRSWWCQGGRLNLWSSETQSLHNSQHLLDPYTLTHILHGMLFYAVLRLLFGRWASPSIRWVMAVGIESAWEVIENTGTAIEKYRANTISLGYYGDSIANSLGDIAACALGYGLAAWLPSWGSAVGFLVVEAGLLWWIRDSLLLNILMLIWPIEAVKQWQLRG